MTASMSASSFGGGEDREIPKKITSDSSRATAPKSRNTWYQPLEAQEDIDRAVHWVIGRPHIFLNTAGDIHLLPKVLDAASRYASRPSAEDMTAMLDEQRMTSLFGI